MPKTLLLFICLLFFSKTFCQSLEGEWEGWYNFPYSPKDTAIIKVQFKLKKDSTYDIYSFTEHENYKATCKMSYRMPNRDSIYLEETEVIKAINDSLGNHLQVMSLMFENGFKSMKGRWVYKEGKLNNFGKVAFFKKT